ncbi:MAG: cytidine deaminase [Chloroflexota bacterium]|nr:cytidine deaminase [Chloroflexota bacterium]
MVAGSGPAGEVDGGLTGKIVERMFAVAEEGRTRSHSPYSEFAVGAAVLTETDAIVPGTNVENASYGATICAERAAVLGAISDGAGRPVAVAIVSDARKAIWPCGECLQVLAEFGGGLRVLTRGRDGAVESARLDELLTRPFDEVPG